MTKTGIYFLIKRKIVVYIGSTKQFPIRFNNPGYQFDFDTIRFIQCPESKLFEWSGSLLLLMDQSLLKGCPEIFKNF